MTIEKEIKIVTDISRAITDVNNLTDKPYRVVLKWKPKTVDVMVFEYEED